MTAHYPPLTPPFCNLTVNPSYVTNEVTFESCPYLSATSGSTLEYTKNVKRYHGDSVLGIYGPTYERFLNPNVTLAGTNVTSRTCFPCDGCERNTTAPTYYRSARTYTYPTYGLAYRGTDYYYRVPY